MVKHMVAWSYADGFTSEENQSNAEKAKKELEGLKDLIEGIVSINVLIDPLATSDSDILLDIVFESEEALNAYTIHPEHVRVGKFVRSVVKNRKCIDFHL